MFVAQTTTHALVTLRSHEQAAALTGAFFCPQCGGALIIKNGQVLPAHFAHRGHACTPSEPESPTHMRGKLWLAELGERLGYTVAMEQYYPEIQQRADVVWTRGETTLVLEFQCSPLSGARLAVRTQGYAKLGLRCVWILGAPYLRGAFGRRQAKFLQWSARDGWHWWGFDGRQLVVHATSLTRQWDHGYTTAGEWQRARPLVAQALAEARAIGRRLYYRDGLAMGLQALAYVQQRNLAGVPWLVHAEPTRLPGLLAPEWALRTEWLLTVGRQDFTAAADAAWWAHQAAQQALLTPLLAAAPPLAAVRQRWLAVLTASGAIEKTATGWRWRQTLQWYDTLEAKLTAGAARRSNSG
ncbi:competence protein CoiA [Lacticaseibacillus nasuensis]|uniref:Competence protein n=1 Tax=Lacticaseibacillus nasuensis JCM 17158 TaxID=1291734 RepID=A0A0R1JTR0_9LACO|nr:competence protein CoiA family protein [Lacticaseibacillus nasuensis]KRK72627.1 Competence protein [Lacticaseibacillus nasuensis JCM 17158]